MENIVFIWKIWFRLCWYPAFNILDPTYLERDAKKAGFHVKVATNLKRDDSSPLSAGFNLTSFHRNAAKNNIFSEVCITMFRKESLLKFT